MRLGDLEIFPLSDGTFRLDGGAMFGVVPKILWERRLASDERNRVTLGLRPLLVRTGGQNVLIDAGVGDKLSGKEAEMYGVDRTEHLELSLARVGLNARDITLVIATHLHLDHAGGFTTLVDGVLAPAFPNARYLVRRGEWEDATHPHERSRASYLSENFLPIQQAGLLDLIETDGEVAPGVSVVRTGGHTSHHQIVRLTSKGRTAIFAGDLIPTAAHVDEPWVMGYDLYPMDTLACKRALVPEAIAGEYVMFFEHDPTLAAGIIRLEHGKKRVERVA